MSLAGAGEILVSTGVRDVLDPTQFGFSDRGSHELKGLVGPRQVYAVEDHAPLRSSA